jgi:hypothetical protein
VLSVQVLGVYSFPVVGRVEACVGRCGSWPAGVIAKTLTSDSLLPNHPLPLSLRARVDLIRSTNPRPKSAPKYTSTSLKP